MLVIYFILLDLHILYLYVKRKKYYNLKTLQLIALILISKNIFLKEREMIYEINK